MACFVGNRWNLLLRELMLIELAQEIKIKDMIAAITGVISIFYHRNAIRRPGQALAHLFMKTH